MKQLKHKNILPLYASFVEEEELWMVMPFVAGGAALDIMQRQHNGVCPAPPLPLPPPLPAGTCALGRYSLGPSACRHSPFPQRTSVHHQGLHSLSAICWRALCLSRPSNRQLLCTIGDAILLTLRVAASKQGGPRSARASPGAPGRPVAGIHGLLSDGATNLCVPGLCRC